MSATLFPLTAPLSIGEVLDAGFRLFRATVLACLPFATFAVIAGQLPGIYSVSHGRPPGSFTPGDLPWVAVNVASALLTVALVGAIFVQQHRVAAGASRSMRVALAMALRRVAVAVGLVLLLAFGLAVVGALATMLSRVLGTAWVVMVLAPLLAWAGVSVLFAWPAVLVEGSSIRSALRSSLALVSGNRLRTALILLVALAAVLALYSIAVIVGIVIATLLGSADLAFVTAVTNVLLVVLGAFGVPFYTALILAAYEDLKVRRQGSDLERRIENLGAS